MTIDFPKRLFDGYRSFRRARLPVEQARFESLAEAGQQPEIMVIGCCDSRVSPEVIFDARPGELFVSRNVANLVPPYSPDGQALGVLAAVEFAILALQVKHIVVLGHARCGGIRAFALHSTPLSAGDFIGRWVDLIAPALETVGPQGDRPLEDYLARLEQASLVQTLENLGTFPFVDSRVRAGELSLHAAHFDVANGLLAIYDRAAKTFMLADAAWHATSSSSPGSAAR